MQMQNDLKSQLLGNYGLWHTPWWQSHWFYASMIALAVIVGLLITVGIFFWVRTWRKKMTPWAQARLNLKALEILQPHESKKFYSGLTDILKEYISERYAINVRGQTDQEVVLFLEQLKLSDTVTRYFQDIIQGGTLSKFANQQAVKAHMEQNLKQAFFIIEQTVPTEK